MCDDFIDDFGELDAESWRTIGPLSEELSREKREKERIEKDMFGDEEDELR